MKSESKSMERRKRRKFSPGCLVAIGVMFGCAVSLFWADLRYGNSLVFRQEKLRLVMDTYYFGNGLANLTGNTSILRNVVTENLLHYTVEHCERGHCNGSPPPNAIGDYFKVVKLTGDFAVIELEDRPIITDRNMNPQKYLRWCYLLVREDGDWRVDSMYYNCNGYLRQLNT